MLRKSIAIIMIILMTFNLAACGKQEKKRYEAEFLQLFDTVTRIVGYSVSKEEFTKRAQLIHDRLEEYHQLYDIYHDYEGINNIKTINDQAGIAPVKVDRRIIDLLKFSKNAYDLTDGEVNVAYGAVLKIWHEYREEGIDSPQNAKLPPMKLLKEASGHTDINQMIIDEKNSTVFLKDPEMSLDVGAIAKGYATEKVSRIAMQNGFISGLISVGGNVRAIGKKADGQSWKVGIQNPMMEDGASIRTVEITDASLVTSGVYERYYTVDGKNYHHIIDPDTLYPAAYYLSVSIYCPDSGLADALSTSVFNMPFEQGKALIEKLPDTEAMWIFPNGEIKYSSNFEKILSD